MVEKVLIVLKEWRQLHLMKLAGLLACTLMVIPSADAVDAIKTCACLLKECRYLILIGVFSLFDYNMIATEATRIPKCATHASSPVRTQKVWKEI